MIIEKFEEQAVTYAAKEAVITETTRLTYVELNAYANRVAHAIIEIDTIKTGDKKKRKEVAALLFEHSADMVVAVIAALKADKIYVPLDISYPESRLVYMLEDSEAHLLLTNSANADLAEKLAAKTGNEVKIVNINTIGRDNSVSADNPDRQPSGDRMAYILYTSGSTGRPKGVLQNHENVCYYIRNWTQRFSITAADRMTLFSAFSHDGAGQDMFGALHNGATLYPYNILNQPNIAELSQWLIREKITIWHSVPTFYRYFINTLGDEDIGRFVELRFILLGGEPIRDHDIQEFQRFFPQAVLANVYGQTESSVNTIWAIKPDDAIDRMLIGDPLDRTTILLVDEDDEIVEDLGVGEIIVACGHIALGYWKDKENTEKVFFHDPELGRLYCTGDLGQLMADGSIECLGRKDSQVKIRGFRVEVGEIETCLLKHDAVKEAAVVPREDDNHMVSLCAYIVPNPPLPGRLKAPGFTVSDMREYLSRELPVYMIPSYLVHMEELPLTPNGKVDRKKLPEPERFRPQQGVTFVAPQTNLEIEISNIWKEVLGLDKVGVKDNFFDLGGNSFAILKIMRKLHEVFHKDVPVVSLFRYPTIHSFVEYFKQEHEKSSGGFSRQTLTPTERARLRKSRQRKSQSPSCPIAVIGMAGRFPGARNLDEFWDNLKKGVETISFFSTGELEQRDVDRKLLQDPNYVKAYGVLKDIEYFDPGFFNYSPNEALMMDPQLRLLHECSWEALENAGYNPHGYDGLVGLYVGNAPNQYWVALTYLNQTNSLETVFLNNNYSTKVSYKLNLTGPSVIIQTACSTSLVAIHFACQELSNDKCDIALAGGVSLVFPDKVGYLFQEGMILSQGGHCRAFDAGADGTIFGNGVGMVVLKRLKEALEDGDNLDAVIKGSAINNDGSRKVGLTAPSVEGQADVIAAARQEAGIEPESISYIETHGTGTILGDPVEIEALKLAFETDKTGYCAIGSVKTNVGHLNSAAGVAGFIKAVLTLKHRVIPPTLHFEMPNPRIDFENSPFYVNTQLKEWKGDGYPMRAGVSSFGIGGTNAHVILEEAPIAQSAQRTADREGRTGPGAYRQGRGEVSSLHISRQHQLILLSAKTPSALDKMTRNLVNYFKDNPGINLADASYTLKLGRKAFKYRQMVVCSRLEEVIDSLSTQVLHMSAVEEGDPAVIFMFPGQGSQYINMAREIYETEPVFREEMDRCFELIEPLLGCDLKEILYPSLGSNGSNRSHMSNIDQTEIAQPLLFAFEYSLAKLLMAWGITPHAMIGHSIGEYTAACLSGVFSLEDALKLVALRGKLMQKMPEGSMLSIPLPEQELTPLLKENISLAAVNSSSHCVVAGSHEAIGAFKRQLDGKGYETRLLHTSHAFHSSMMDPILLEFERAARGVSLNKPLLPYISNVTGEWISIEQATDPGYWSKHLRSTVRFCSGLTQLLKEANAIFVEVGPGRSLSTFARQHEDKKPGQRVVALIRHSKDQVSDSKYLLDKIGHLWLYGKVIDWVGFYGKEKRHRIPLPSYPFENQRYWLEGNPFKMGEEQVVTKSLARKKTNIAEWFYVPLWKRSSIEDIQTAQMQTQSKYNWLVLVNEGSIGAKLVQRLKQVYREEKVTIVKTGHEFAPLEDGGYIINPRNDNDYHTLFRELQSRDKVPHKIIHLWSMPGQKKSGNNEPGMGKDLFKRVENALDLGFHSLLYLAQAIGRLDFNEGSGNDETEIIVITNRMQAVTGKEVPEPQEAPICGAAQVISREYAKINCCTIDIDIDGPGAGSFDEALIEKLMAEIQIRKLAGHADMHAAYRNNQRWVRTFEQTRLDANGKEVPLLKKKGVYLVTGGLGGIGLVLGEYLAKTLGARLILTGRSAFPVREEWENWLLSHDPADSISVKIRKIRELEALGSEVLVLSADVANMEQMQDAVDQVEKRFGKINGIIHTAGLADGALIQRRTRELSETIFAPKIKGTLVLEAIFSSRELDFFVLCSSISSVLAPVGQVAYCAANAFLDAFAYYKTKTTGDKLFTISINWDNWQEVGMAAKAVAQFTPPPVRQVKINHPLFDNYEIYDSYQQRLISNLHTSKHWVLAEHRLMEQAMLPGTAYLEMARAAVESHANNGLIELKEVYFLSPLLVKENETKEIHTLLKKESDGYAFSIISRLNAGEDQWVEHARGKAGLMKTGKPTQYAISEIEERCSQQEIVYNPDDYSGQGGAITFGPRWNGLRWAKFGKNQAIALLELPDVFAGDMEFYKLHPALLDVATAFLHSTREDRGAYLPFHYKKIRINAPLPVNVYCYARAVDVDANDNDEQSQKEILRFNITIMNEQGIELVAVEEYTLKRVNANAGIVEPVHDEQNFSLVISSAGAFDNFVLQPIPRKKPGPGEIEIAVRATGLNFKEVLLAMGVLGAIEPGFAFGLECAGKITACGEGVEDFAVGDDVIAFGSSCFSPYVITSTSLVAHKPSHLSFEEAATIPVAFLTAYYALIQLGQLKKGERVLIHSAAGGVGLAAVKIARYQGAEIFATAGNEEKRSYLRSLGLRHVMDSRSLDFADEVMKRTEGKGVHVVLNSLAGEFIPKSLSLLAPYGRFIEIGMRDMLKNSSLGLRPFLKGLSYFSLFLAGDLPGIATVWREVMQHFENKTLTPLPLQTFPITQAAQAFEFMTIGKHIGKIVVVREEKEEGRMHNQRQIKVAQPYNSFFSAGGNRDSQAHDSQETPLREGPTGSLKDGILPWEGVDVFKRILGKKTLPQVVISTTDLFDRIEKSRGSDEAWLSEELSRKTAPIPQHARPEISVPYVAPQTETEQILANIWQELLGIKRVGIHDDFFELGGDSLKAVSIVNRIRKELQVDIPVFTMFSYQTIRAFTQYLAKEKRNQHLSNREDNQSELLDKASQKMKKSIQRLKNMR